MSTKAAIGLLAFIALIVAYSGALFVDETELVIITQFGEYKRTLHKPGLAFKLPLVQTETRVDRRIQVSDAPPEEYLTLDKKRLVADPLTRWRIVDALLYFKTVADEARARQRLDDVVRSELRQELASHNFGDIIGNARGPLMDKVSERAREKAKEFGIDIVDVRIKRADLPTQVQQSVYSRMKAERERQAKEYRSEGQEESDKITSEADKEREIILAKAYREAQVLQGDGDAEASRIYAGAYSKDPEFYAFTRNLQLYEASIDASATLVLSTRSELLQYLTKPGAGD